MIQVTYRQLNNDEKIKEEDLHSLDGGASLFSLKSSDFVGRTPSFFCSNRTFWRKIDSERV